MGYLIILNKANPVKKFCGGRIYPAISNRVKNLFITALLLTGLIVPCYGGELPDTGQEQSYTTTFGEDHDYQPSDSQPSYTDNGDGTISDNKTGLMWLKDANNYNSGGKQTWEAALSGCESFSYAGYSDWRLPNRRELMSIVDYGEQSPAINTTYFLNTQSRHYWTSTTGSVFYSTYAWYVYFLDGRVDGEGKSNDNYVRPVRAGP